LRREGRVPKTEKDLNTEITEGRSTEGTEKRGGGVQKRKRLNTEEHRGRSTEGTEKREVESETEKT